MIVSVVPRFKAKTLKASVLAVDDLLVLENNEDMICKTGRSLRTRTVAVKEVLKVKNVSFTPGQEGRKYICGRELEENGVH